MSVISNIFNRLAGRQEKPLMPDEINHQQAMDWFKNHHDVYERLTNAVIPLIPADGVIFDIGANIGYFSLQLAKKMKFQGPICLFEPIPNLAELCRTTFRDTGVDARIFEFALSDENGSFDIFAARNGNIGWNTLIQEKTSDDMERIHIQAHRFDDLGINLQPDFIKIDVEGAEYKVLGGMLDSIRKWQKLPVILCEIGWGTSHPNWDKEIAIFQELEALGYNFINLEKQPVDMAALDKTTDILFVPN